MTVAETIVAHARSLGIEHAFGLPGSGALMDVMEALRRNGLHFVAMAHESSAAVAAAYYGELKGSAGLAMAIKGPGAGNLAGGALVAHFERKPVVCLCECAPDSLRSMPLAQVCDHAPMFAGYARSMLRIQADGAADAVARAFGAASREMPGPVLLELPSNFGSADSRGEPREPRLDRRSPSPPPPTPESLARAAELTSSFRRPVIILGADVLRDGAAAEAASLAHGLGAAVLVTMEARGVIPEDDPRFAAVYTGLPGAAVPGNLALRAADGVVLAGVDAIMTEAQFAAELPCVELCRFGDSPTLAPSPRVRVDGSLRSSLAALARAHRAHRAGPGFDPSEIAAIREHAARLCERPAGVRFAVQDIIRTTRELMPPQGVLVSETGVFVLMLEQIWSVTRPHTFFGTTAGRTMGLTLPALLGAKLARPDLPMVGIGGDGSLLMRLGDLETFARAGVAAPIVVVNDRCLGTIRARQKLRGLPAFGLDLTDVDFAAIARACGLRGATVDTPEGYEGALAEALAARVATVIDARVDAEAYRDSFVATTGA